MPQVNGRFLRQRREELDMSAGDVAAAAECAEGTVWNLEGGSHGSRRLLHRVARVLNQALRQHQENGLLEDLAAVSVDDLLAEDDDSEPAKKDNEHQGGGAGTGPKDTRPPTKKTFDSARAGAA